MSITAAEFYDRHSVSGDDEQSACRCGMTLGPGLSLETHRAQELEGYAQERIDEALTARRTAWVNAQSRVAGLLLTLQDSEVPLYVQSALEQIITDAEVQLHNTIPSVLLSRAVEAGPPLVMVLTPAGIPSR